MLPQRSKHPREMVIPPKASTSSFIERTVKTRRGTLSPCTAGHALFHRGRQSSAPSCQAHHCETPPRSHTAQKKMAQSFFIYEYMYMYIDTYIICICICTHTHTHTHTHTYIYIYIYIYPSCQAHHCETPPRSHTAQKKMAESFFIYEYMYMYIDTYIICIYTCTHTHTYTHTHTHIYIYIYIYTYILHVKPTVTRYNRVLTLRERRQTAVSFFI